jgi:hypothetical protein
MADYLIHHPLVQVYLLMVGALVVALIRDRIRHPADGEDDDGPSEGPLRR